MSKTVAITSKQQLESLLSTSKIVVIDFWAEWCGPCKAMNPAYEQLSSHLSRPDKVTFTKVNIDEQQEIAQLYSVRSIPTFKIFKNTQNVETIVGSDRGKLSQAVQKIAEEVDGGEAGGFGETSSSSWIGATLPRGYKDITDQVDVRGLDLLNADSTYGTARDLFASGRPSSLDGKSKASDKKDWIESDTDEQLMLFMPFQSTLKVHSLHLTSLPPSEEDDAPMRPKTIRLYKNRAHTLGFDEADDVEATQEIELKPTDWDEKTRTAKIELRFVKFQNISSLVVFLVDGESDGEKTRLDRVRIIGESGEKRDMGKLEKIGDGSE